MANVPVRKFECGNKREAHCHRRQDILKTSVMGRTESIIRQPPMPSMQSNSLPKNTMIPDLPSLANATRNSTELIMLCGLRKASLGSYLPQIRTRLPTFPPQSSTCAHSPKTCPRPSPGRAGGISDRGRELVCCFGVVFPRANRTTYDGWEEESVARCQYAVAFAHREVPYEKNQAILPLPAPSKYQRAKCQPPRETAVLSG
jgi:hypothetical protein